MTNLATAYSERQFRSALELTMANMLVDSSLHPVDHPSGVLLGGQSGAGKSTLHKVYKDVFDYNTVVINGDEYRKQHPHFDEIQARYGIDSPAHTAQWAGEMTEGLIEAFSTQGYNLIIEGTLRTSSVPLKTAALLVSRGYTVSAAIMAVKPEISLVSCQIRYEMMRIAGTTPRATDPAHHNKIIHDIVENLAALEESDLIDEVRLYNRSSRCLYPNDNRASASETLREVLFGDWMPEEEAHLRSLEAQLERLKAE